jgi:hypothetical protein
MCRKFPGNTEDLFYGEIFKVSIIKQYLRFKNKKGCPFKTAS